MGSQLLNQDVEAAVLDRLMRYHKDDLPPAAAEFLLTIKFPEGDEQRMLELAERSEAGALTPEEEKEFDGYLHVGNLLALMQSKARLALKMGTPFCRPS
jgi:hypothetical protein